MHAAWCGYMAELFFRDSDLPPMPQVVSKIIQIDENNINLSSDQLEALIAVDPALSSKILRIANSAFYARTNKISSLSQSITLLGFKTIKSLTLLVSTSGLFSRNKKGIAVQKEIWMRSVLTALLSRLLSEKTRHSTDKDDAFIGGLLKNVGMLIMHNRNPDEYGKIFMSSSNGSDLAALRENEKSLFGITAPEVSKQVMEKWNFPDQLVKVPLYQDGDNTAGSVPVLVRLAEILVFLTNLTGNFRHDEEFIALLQKEFNHYAYDLLKLDKQEADYLIKILPDEIRKDEFYKFSEELFTM